MGIVPDSRNPSDPFEKKTNAQRSVRHPGSLLDSHNPKPKITTPVTPPPKAKGSSTGTTTYPK